MVKEPPVPRRGKRYQVRLIGGRELKWLAQGAPGAAGIDEAGFYPVTHMQPTGDGSTVVAQAMRGSTPFLLHLPRARYERLPLAEQMEAWI